MASSTYLITAKNKKEQELIDSLIRHLNLKGKRLATEELEDLGLSMLLANVDRTKKAPRERVLRQLRAK
jgi:hypothetical protein